MTQSADLIQMTRFSSSRFDLGRLQVGSMGWGGARYSNHSVISEAITEEAEGYVTSLKIYLHILMFKLTSYSVICCTCVMISTRVV